MLLFSYLRFITKYPWHLSNLVHSIRLNTFTKIDIISGLIIHFLPKKMMMKNYQRRGYAISNLINTRMQKIKIQNDIIFALFYFGHYWILIAINIITFGNF